jgi:ribosome maturation factor RimP
MIDRTLVIEIVENNIAETDMFIVDVKVKQGNIISIVLDSDTVVSIDNCVEVNRYVCNSLEAQGEEDFEVSVYSAGLNEPFKLQRQYVKHIDKEVEIVRKSGEKQTGILRSVKENNIELEYAIKEKETGSKKTKTVQLKETIGMDSIKSTRLVIKI